jgi:GAF domain-containing protein
MGIPGDEKSAAEVLAAFADRVDAGLGAIDVLHILVRSCARYTSADGAGVLLADASRTLHIAASTNERTSDVEEAQIGAREGPCFQSFCQGILIEVPVIADRRGAWPAFAAIAGNRGFCAVRALPLRVENTVVGGLNLFSSRPGRMTDENTDLADAMMTIAWNSVQKHHRMKHPGTLDTFLNAMLEDRFLIEQAKEVLASRYGVPMDDAFSLLRSHAHKTNKGLRNIAERIVGRPAA